MEILDLTTITDADILNNVGTRPIAVLAGSGVSLWQPTELPTGQELTETIFDLLFRSCDSGIEEADSEILNELLRVLPFEAVMERCPNEYALQRLILDLFGGARTPNPVHKALATLVSEGRISSITTTNYDLALDAALRSADPPMHFVFTPSHVTKSNARTYFKIHGSAERDYESTLVYSLRLEGAMAPWKRELLTMLMSNRTLLIIGYSGLDFEVCPEIPATRPTQVIWNFFTREELDRSPGLKRLIAASVPITAVIGDMRDLLTVLTGKLVRADLSKVEHRKELVSKLRDSFSDDDLILWRARVLNSMAFTRLAKQTLEILNPAENQNWLVSREYADSWHHAGAYKTSARWYRRAASIAPNDMMRRKIMLAASDAVRCYGHWRKANRIIDQAVAGLDYSLPEAKSVRALELLKRTLVARHWIRLALLLRMNKTADRLQNRVVEWVKEGKRLALDDGLWYDFQQFRFWSERLGLPEDVVKSDSHFEPPPSKEGYQQLGYQLALIMAKRDHAWAAIRSGTFTAETVQEIRKCFSLIEAMGSHSEAWKLARLLLNTTTGKQRWHYGSAFIKHFFSCEYALTIRPFFLLLGDFSSR